MARRAQRHDGHHRVLTTTAADAIAVPGDAVSAVTVVAQPGRPERLAKGARVVSAQRLPGLVEQRVGQRVLLVVEAQQPGHDDLAVVHGPALGVPGHGVGQGLEQQVGAADPGTAHLDPGAVGQDRAFGVSRQRAHGRFFGDVQQGRLQHRDMA
jgi:hypothetical protein